MNRAFDESFMNKLGFIRSLRLTNEFEQFFWTRLFKWSNTKKSLVHLFMFTNMLIYRLFKTRLYKTHLKCICCSIINKIIYIFYFYIYFKCIY